MNCPRCGEMMYGSVCPRCGNVVMSDRATRAAQRNTSRTPSRTTNRVSSRNNDITFMDNNNIKNIKAGRKKSGINFNMNIYKLLVVVLAVLCVFLFFKNKSVTSQLNEAQNTINTQNDSIKAKDQEISDLKAAAAAETAPASEGGDTQDDSSAPEVEFDENGNVVNINENGSSDNDDDSDTPAEYKSGDTYTVVAGDNGTSICNKVYGEYSSELWEKLLEANGMTTSSSFHPGDELKIP